MSLHPITKHSTYAIVQRMFPLSNQEEERHAAELMVMLTRRYGSATWNFGKELSFPGGKVMEKLVQKKEAMETISELFSGYSKGDWEDVPERIQMKYHWACLKLATSLCEDAGDVAEAKRLVIDNLYFPDSFSVWVGWVEKFVSDLKVDPVRMIYGLESLRKILRDNDDILIYEAEMFINMARSNIYEVK